MRLPLSLAAFTAAAALAGAASAQETAAEGQYTAALQRMIAQAADGICAEDVMGSDLLEACNGNIVGMGAAISALGPVDTMTFLRAEETPEHGRIELYAVGFAGGERMTWGIGGLRDGKYDVAFARGGEE